jgi:hypothetical protein
MVLLACGKEQTTSPGAHSTASADEVPFVMFTERSVVIERLGTTIPAPAAVGSTVSPRTLSSSDPSVVEVTPAGELRARALGRATIRATGNPAQALEVEVREQAVEPPRKALVEAPRGPLTLRPPSADLRVGQVVVFEAEVGGHRVQPDWHLVGPALLRQTAPGAFVAIGLGKTKTCASAARQSVCAEVAVGR